MTLHYSLYTLCDLLDTDVTVCQRLYSEADLTHAREEMYVFL